MADNMLENLHTFIYDVDSSDKHSDETDCNFTVELPILETFEYVSVYGVTFDKTYYNVQSGFNTFTMNGNTITVPPASYSVDRFNSVVGSLLTAVGTLGTWTLTYSQYTGKMTLSTTSGAAMTMILSSDGLLARCFGLAVGTHSFTSTYTSTYVVDFKRTGVMYLSSNIGLNYNGKSVIYTVHPISVAFDQISSINSAPQLYKFKINKHQTYRFTLYDDNYNILDLNGHQLIITLLFSNK